MEEQIQAGDNRRERIDEYIKLNHLSCEMVDILIDHVTVGRRIAGTRDIPVEIYRDF